MFDLVNLESANLCFDWTSGRCNPKPSFCACEAHRMGKVVLLQADPGPRNSDGKYARSISSVHGIL